MEAWDYWRALNVALACVAIAVNVYKVVRFRLWNTNFEMDSALGLLAAMAWCFGYILATSVAWLQGVPAGIWTAIMSVPIAWTLIAGMVSHKPTRKSRW